MSMNEFQKYDPLWSYFSMKGYSSSLLKDFSIIDEETHSLFVQLLCQNRKIRPALQTVDMYIDEFDTRAYQLLRQENCFTLLKKMALPLQMRHWELNVSDAQYSEMSLEQAGANFSHKNFGADFEFRWNTYFSFAQRTIQDLKIPYPKQLKAMFCELEEDEVENQKKAQILETEFKKAVQGIGEYLFQKELIWYAKEEKLSNLYLRFSRLFNVSEGVLTNEELLAHELQALDVMDKAIIWTQTNNQKAKHNAFDVVYDARQTLTRTYAGLKKIAHWENSINQKKDDNSHEKD